MDSLERAVAGSWFDLREQIRHPIQFMEVLFPSAQRPGAAAVLNTLAVDLEQAVEGGVVEVTRARMMGLYVELEEAQFSSGMFAQLEELALRARGVVAIMAIHRALLMGELPIHQESAPTSGDTDTPPPKTASAAEIQQIIQDIQTILLSDPSAKMNGAVKNILLQVQKYRTEAAQFQKLRQQASGHRLELYSRTFAASFQKIFASIQRNYEHFQAEQSQQTASAPGNPNPLTGLTVIPWAKIIVAEMEEAHRVIAVLSALNTHTSGLRQPLVVLSRRRSEMLTLLQREEEARVVCAGSPAEAHQLNRFLARQIAWHLRHRASHLT